MDRKMAGILENLRREREKVLAEARRLETEIYSGTISNGALDDDIEELRALRMKIHHLDTRIKKVSSQEANLP